MSYLSVKNERDYANCQDQAVDEDCRNIEFKAVGDSLIGLKASELLKLAARNSSGCSGVGSRAIACSDDIVLFEVETTNLALMNTSAVIPTGRRSGESLNFSLGSQAIVGNDAHRVSSFNILDILPTDSMFGERVDYLDSFIEENDYRVYEELIGNRASKKTPNRCNGAASESIVKEVNVSEGAKEEKAHVAEEIGTPGAKELSVSHILIFSRAKISRAAEMRAA